MQFNVKKKTDVIDDHRSQRNAFIAEQPTEVVHIPDPSIDIFKGNTARATSPEKDTHPKKNEQKKKKQEKKNDTGYVITSYLFLFLFALIQGIIIYAQKTGPFYDEAIYATAGLRTLDGKGVTDGYLVWFAGSLLWPVLSGIGYTLHGLLGIRAIAAILTCFTVLFSYLTAKNLFGVRAAFFSVVLFVFSGPLLALAHLGVYDVPALTFTSISLWAMTRFKSDHRLWLSISAISLAIATIAKYPIALMMLPILGILITFRKQKSVTDICLFLFIFIAVFLAFFLSFQYQVGSWLLWSSRNKPTFGSSEATIIAAQLYLGLLPLSIALLGFFVAPRKKEALILLLAGLIWPAYHILSRNPVSDNKHVIFGFLFLYPLMGLFCAYLWQKKWFGKPLATVLCMLLAIVGAAGLYILDFAWPDVRQPATYLSTHSQMGDQFLIDNAWPYTMYLYADNKTKDPWAVYDNYRINNKENSENICDYTWYVDEKGSYSWSDALRKQIKACHTFIPVYHTSSSAIQLGPDLQYKRYTITTTIYKNLHANR
ncbi:hypothetical protein KDA_55410 [Dictyobacter alpinus]|uniref:Glycosyltransferase RgtA/B/C/D-like domain-containing protein n=1 Tax=Dictyobacter alpinus TaxID=2014873 RepID=A0A402BFL8_9CHLR|nr:glycosyltransferase family 39 protein [Dictyobacter alpinus]GCE30057.1 hypothetical protein KDA_55410 [Dictyobacter alpinus]